MTDEKIIEALECCENEINFCSICPYFLQNKENDFCKEDMAKDALALIKRQQEEIESLEADYENVYKQASADILASIADGGTSCEWCIDKHRAEAVREFAERLKEQAKELHIGDNIFLQIVGVGRIDNLVREMTEEKK